MKELGGNASPACPCVAHVQTFFVLVLKEVFSVGRHFALRGSQLISYLSLSVVLVSLF